jgi:phosphatidylinositol alpha-1,6-mannosyltransferase
MRTLLFTLEYPPFHGGVASYYGNIVKFFPDRSITILHNNDDRLINDRLPMLKWLPAIFELKKKIKQEHIDHILVGHILPLGTAAMILKLITGVRYSVFIHGTDLNMAQAKSRRRWLARRILAGAENIICNSSFAGKLAEKFIGASAKIKIVNPGIEPGNASDQKTIENLKTKYGLADKLVLLTVGRLVSRKGIDKVLESMPLALQRIPNLFYAIIGNGPDLVNLRSQISNYLLDKSSAIITDATDEERDAWYDLCDIFVLAGRQIKGDVEGFGIVYLEAGVHGKPVIAGDTGGVRDAVVDGLSGLVIDATNAENIALAIVRLAADRALRERLGEQGRVRALDEFSWQRQAKKIYDIISDGK